MSQYAYTHIEDGTVIGATTINGMLEDVRDAINGITVASLAIGTFSEWHAGLLLLSGGASQPFQVDGHHGTHVYSYSVFGTSLAYSSFGANGGTETTASYTGDRVIIGHPDATGPYVGAGGPLCKITFSSGVRVSGASPDYCTGLLVSLDVEIVHYVREACEEAMFCIQALVGGTWYTVANSERFITLKDKQIASGTEDIGYIVSLRALIDTDTLSLDFGVATTSAIDGIRGMLSLVDAAAASDAITLNNWNMSFMALRAEKD